MKHLFLLLVSFSMVLASSNAQGVISGIHVGGGMGYDNQTEEACVQFSLGINANRLYASVNKTFPLDRHQPQLWQGRLGFIAGERAKAIIYGGMVNRRLKFSEENSQERELYPERFVEYSVTAPMYGVEFSLPLGTSKCRIFSDLNFSGLPLNDTKTVLKNRIQFVPVFGIKCLLGNKDDCYPKRSNY